MLIFCEEATSVGDDLLAAQALRVITKKNKDSVRTVVLSYVGSSVML
jgi:hypothetical protein